MITFREGTIPSNFTNFTTSFPRLESYLRDWAVCHIETRKYFLGNSRRFFGFIAK